MSTSPVSWVSTRGTSSRWPLWYAVRLVAESLRPVPDPLGAVLALGSAGAPAPVAASIARGLAPAEDPGPIAPWLRPEQEVTCRRLRAAVDRHGGALLANPVGSGKTYVALAAAWSSRARRLACIVPAALVPQWDAALQRVGVTATCWSHERLSRGTAPPLRPDYVIVDESHRFRNPSIRRYDTLARWIGGAPTALLSATPVVNRLADLAHQLRLAVRDDALRAHGVPSLQRLLAVGRSHPALGLLLVSTAAGGAGRPVHSVRWERPEADARVAATVRALDRLRLSHRPGVERLLRGVLFRALASSPAALVTALRRYRSLLRHVEEAHAARCSPGRALIRALTGAAGEQLVLWGLVDEGEAPADLVPEDLPAVERLIGRVEASADRDVKLGPLRRSLADGAPTLVFTCAVATVRHLRLALGDSGRVAWCTGAQAGIGRSRLARGDVLAHFANPRGDRGPRVLLATDVAAEGFDLPGAARVVHYDLPWTAVRLEQRDGRIIRLSSLHPQVETVRILPPGIVERRLRQLEILGAKAALPALAGLAHGGRALWQWRADVADAFGGSDPVAGVARLAEGPPGLLVGIAIRGRPEDAPIEAPLRPIATTAIWIDDAGAWTERAALVERRLQGASRVEAPALSLLPGEREVIRARLAPVIRILLARVRAERWAAPLGDPNARRWARSLGRLAAEAARRRDATGLRLTDRALRLVAGGHTAGEALMLREPVPQAAALAARVAAWPAPTPRWAALEATVTGVVVFSGD